MDKLKLLYAAIRNCRKKYLNKELIGFTLRKKLPPVKKRDLFAYAKATRDNNPCYQAENPLLPPFFIARLMWAPVLKVITHKKLNLNLLRMVHTEQRIYWYKPVTLKDELELILKINDIRECKAGEILELSAIILVNGEKVTHAVSGLLVRFNNQAAKRNIYPEKKGKLFWKNELKTYKGQQIEYARISNDKNFIHTSRIAARLAGLPGRILHGICVMAMTCAVLTEKLLKNDLSRLKYMQVRFSSPVIPGEKLEVFCYKTVQEKKAVSFDLKNKKGRSVLKEGILKFC